MAFQGDIFDGTHPMEMEEDHYKAWLQKIRRGIGGHAIGNLMGAGYGNPCDVFDGFLELAEKVQVTPAMKRGLELEDDALDHLEEVTGMKLFREDDDLWIRHENKFFTGKVDAYVEADGEVIPTSRGRGIVEVKNPMPWVWSQWRDEGVALGTQLQANWYMGLTGTKWCVFVIFNANDWRMLGGKTPPVMEFDEELFRAQRERAEQFLNDHIFPRVRPDPDTVADELADVAPESLGAEEVVVTDSAYTGILTRYFDAREEADLTKHQVKLLRKEVQDLMVELDTEVVKLSDGRKVSWKGSTRKSFSRKLLIAAHPSLDLDPFFETKTVRSFRVSGG